MHPSSHARLNTAKVGFADDNDGVEVLVKNGRNPVATAKATVAETATDLALRHGYWLVTVLEARDLYLREPGGKDK